MRSRLHVFLPFIYLMLGLGTAAWAQPGCPAVDAGANQSLPCTTPCTNLTATPVAGFQPTTYTVGAIPYAPFSFNGPNNVIIGTDDVWSGVVNLPFNFCFFGTNYNQIVIGANGLISFNTAYAGGFCPWQITAAIPNNTNAPINSIMAPWHDIDPSVNQPGQTKSTNWGLYGSAPCRIMVISWRNIPMYDNFFGNCDTQTGLNATHQIVLYETTNIIETYIQSKQLCTNWNGGQAIHGIQNAAGTVAVVVPGRNAPTQWTATNDAWRFTPAGAPNYVVNWYQGATFLGAGNTINVCPPSNATTTYTAQAVYTNCDGSQVTVSDNVNVTTANSFTVTIAPVTDVSCNGGTNGSATATPVGGAPGFTYAWNTVPPQNTQTAINLPAGTYTVTVTDANNCQSTQTITINQPTPLDLSNTSSNTATCNTSQDGSATVNPAGGAGGYTYNWNTAPPQNTQTAINLNPGTYTVTVTDANNCQATTTVNVGSDPPMDLSNTSSNTATCNTSQDGSATVNPAGGAGGYTYNWNTVPAQNTQTAINLNPGTYTVTVTDAAGCQATTTVNVGSDPPMDLSNTSFTNALCFGGSTGTATVNPSGGAGGYTYSWNSVPPQNTQTAINLPAGTYTVTVTDAATCTATTTVNVGQNPQLVASAVVDQGTCGGGTTGQATASAVGGSGAYTYSWSTVPVQTTATIAGLSSGMYYVTVTDALNCTDSASVNIPSSPAATLSFTANNVSCNGNNDGSAIVSVSPAGTYAYLWETGSTIDSIGGLSPGTYTVTVTDTLFSPGGTQFIYTEDFDPSPAGWTLNVPTGVNGADNNFWTISDDEGGVLPPGCGVANNGNQSLHVTSVFCPTCGAAYDAGGLCGILFCPETHMRAEGPVFSTVGFSGLTLTFDFTSVGDGLIDNCEVLYNAGAGWTVLNPSIKSLTCFGGQGQWTNFTAALPAICDNNPTVQIGFNWFNNDDGVGTDPSIAINNVAVYTSAGADTSYCVSVDSVTITEPAPLVVNATGTDATCNGFDNGTASVTYSGGNGNYSVEWSTGATTDVVTGLAPGTYYVTVTDTSGTAGGGGGLVNTTIYSEDFDPAPAWNLNVPTGVNGADFNFWQIDDDEGGVIPPGCGVALNGDQTLHITSVFCPTCGAAYDAGGLCGILFCPETHMRAESPNINTVGYPNPITLNFDFISLGDGLLDNCEVLYNAGAGWNVLNPSIKSVNCFGGQGQWTAFTAVLPAACNNIANLQVGFNWYNNDDGVGNDPSVAINNITLTTQVQQGGGGGNFVLCTAVDSVTIAEPTPLVLTTGFDSVDCFGGSDGAAWVSYSGATPGYNVLWNTSLTTDTLHNLSAGTYTVIVNDAIGCADTATVTVPQPAQIDITVSGFSNVSCFGLADGSISTNTTGGTPGYTWSWNTVPVQNTATATNLGPGVYGVTVTDAHGCTDQLIQSITQPTQLSVSLTSLPVGCNSPVPNGQAFAIASGGAGGYQYNWSNGQSGSPLTGLAAGIYTVTVTDANSCTVVGQVTVTAVPSPSVSAGPDVGFCEGTGGVQITSSAFGGTPPYYYVWTCNQPVCALDSVFDNDPIANPNVTTTYYIQVTDFNGCLSNVDSLVVNVLPLPEVNAGPDIIICGDSAPCQLLTPSVFNAPGPFTYQWTPAIGLNDPTLPNPCARPDTTIIYTLQVTSSNGCVSEVNTIDTNSTVTVHVNPVPVAHAGPDLDICLGDSAMFQAFATGAGPAYDFEWSPFTGLSNPNIANPLASPAATTDYVLVAWSNGCPSQGDTVWVNVHTIPTVNAGPDREMCLGESVLLDAQASGDPFSNGYTFEWTPNTYIVGSNTVEDVTVNPPSTTTYSVVATSEFGCESPPDQVLVTLLPTPIAEAGDNAIICEGSSVLLNGSVYYTTTDPVTDTTQIVVTWFPSSTLDDPNLYRPTATPTGTTMYYFTVNYTVCSTLDSVLVQIVPQPLATIQADTNAICEGDSVMLNGASTTAGSSFHWFPSAGLSNPNIANPIASPGDSVTYYLVVNEGQCTDTAAFTLNAIPGPDMAYMSSFREGCVPLTVSFLDLSADVLLHTWYFGDGGMSNEENPMHTYTQPGQYTVTLSGINTGGCKSDISSLVINVSDTAHADFTSIPDFPVVLTLPNTEVQFRDRSSNAVSWIWDFMDGLSSTEQNPTHTFMQEGEYFVTLTVENEHGCLSRVTHGPFVVMAPDLFIPNVFTPNDDNNNDLFFVRYTGSQPFLLQVYDRWGNLLSESRDKYEGWDGMVGTEPAPAGVYYYHVKIADKEYTGSVTLVR